MRAVDKARLRFRSLFVAVPCAGAATSKVRALVAVVNEALVRKSFPGRNPIGRTIFCPFDSSRAMTIIGVVGDVRQFGPAQAPLPECYMSYQQHQYGTTLSIVARTVNSPIALSETVRRVMQERSPDVPVKFTTMEAMISENVATPRYRSLLFALFAVLAVCLAMAGVYGVMAYAVGRRATEIGLRMALGASTGSVLRLVLRQRTLMITGGHGENSKCGYDYVPKKDLISGLQILFERGEFKIAKTLPYLEVLKIEMPAMEVMVTPSGNETLGAWRTGSMMTWCWRRWRARARYPDRLAGLDGNFVTPGLLRGRKGKRIC